MPRSALPALECAYLFRIGNKADHDFIDSWLSKPVIWIGSKAHLAAGCPFGEHVRTAADGGLQIPFSVINRAFGVENRVEDMIGQKTMPGDSLPGCVWGREGHHDSLGIGGLQAFQQVVRFASCHLVIRADEHLVGEKKILRGEGVPSDQTRSGRSLSVITRPSAEMPPFVELGISVTSSGRGLFWSS